MAAEIDAFVGFMLLSLAVGVLTPKLAWWRRVLAIAALGAAVAFLIGAYQHAQ